MSHAGRLPLPGRWPARLTLGAACAALLAVNLPWLSAPVIDYWSDRQAQSAMVARNFIRSGFNPLWPQVDWAPTASGESPFLEGELPLHPYLAALLSRLAADPVLWGRGLALLSALVALVALYRLTRALRGDVAAAVAVALVAGAPLFLQFGGAFTPHVPSFAAMLVSLLLLERWAARPTRRGLWAAGAAGALAVLLRPTAFQLILPALALCSSPDGRRRDWPAYQTFVAIVGWPAVLWFGYAHLMLLFGGGVSLGLFPTTGVTDKYPALADLLDPDAYATIGHRLWGEVLAPGWGALLIPLGLLALAWPPRPPSRPAPPQGPPPPDGLLPPQGPPLPEPPPQGSPPPQEPQAVGTDSRPAQSPRFRLFLTLWLAAALLDVLLVLRGHVNVPYYHIPMMAPLALLCAHGVASLVERLKGTASRPRGIARGAPRAAALAVALTLALAGSWWSATHVARTLTRYRAAEIDLAAARRLGEVTPPAAQVLVPRSADLYYADRKGHFRWPPDAVGLTDASRQRSWTRTGYVLLPADLLTDSTAAAALGPVERVATAGDLVIVRRLAAGAPPAS